MSNPNQHFVATQLTREIAESYAKDLAILADQIPLVDYSAADILAEQKEDRELLHKWDHSLVVLDQGQPIAFVTGYERKAEGTVQYPKSTLYIGELAVSRSYQKHGIARELLRQFFERNTALGFLSLSGKLTYGIQTNSAPTNQHVINLYKSFGFEAHATKVYPNRVDVVLGVDADQLQF